MVWSVISMWVFRIGFSWLLGVKMQMGVLGVWVYQLQYFARIIPCHIIIPSADTAGADRNTMTIDWLVRAILFIIRYRGTKWQHAMVK